MKITFKSSKLQEGTVKISFDGGNEFREYELAEVKDTGISLNDSQDLDKIKIKGPANILKNLEVISDIKLDSEGIQSPTIKNETEHYYAWVPFEDDVEENGDAEGDYPLYYMTKTLIANEITALYTWHKEYDEDSNPIIKEVGSLHDLGADIQQIDDNKIAIIIGDKTTQFVRYPSKDIDHIKTTITSQSFVMDNDLGKFPHNVTGVIVPEGVTEINGLSEYSKDGIDKITNKSAFSIYPNLKTISLPSSIKSIGYRSFAGCHGFSINIPDGTDVSGGSFSGSTPIEIIASHDILNKIGSRQHEYIERVPIIGDYAYQNCTNLTEVNISMYDYGPTSIGDYAFENCTNLEKVTITCPDNYDIGYCAFRYCKSLTSIDLEGVTSIGGHAFSGCTNLTSIALSSNATSIDGHAFSGCTSLTEITIPDSVTFIGEYAFDDCTGLTEITIPNSVTSISRAVFLGCSSLTSMDIPYGVTSIDDYAFDDCSSLANITIPDSVTSIGQAVFQGCTNLTSIDIPDGVTSIGEYVFSGCSSLTNITIPSSVISIGEYSFGRCTNLATINYMGTQEQWDAIEKPEDWNSACPNVEIIYEYTLAM